MKKIILGALLAASLSANAQLVQQQGTTGAGLNNGAVNTSDYGGGNTFFGNYAGQNNNPKIDFGKNTFIGNKSGMSNTSGMSNSFLGWNSGLNNLTGSRNLFLGSEAGMSNTTGYSNSFLGHAAGNSNTTGTENVFIGTWAGASSQTGFGNIFLGSVAGATNISGFNNIFIGSQSGYKEKGVNNLYMGSASAFNNENGYANVLIGQQSGYNGINGAMNTFLGYMSGHSTMGNGNLFLGHMSGYNELGSNKLYISNSDTALPLIYGDFASKKLGIGGINSFPNAAGTVNVSAYSLFVKGGILTEEVRVALQTGWADYVFAADYKLSPLSEVEAFIKENSHLPNVPSASQVATDGIALGDMSRIQQEKIEELTLYLIEQDKQLKEQQKELSELQELVKALIAQKQ